MLYTHSEFTIDLIDPFICTHFIYLSAYVNESTQSIESSSPFYDLKDDGGDGSYEKFNNLKRMNPVAKTLIAIENDYEFSSISSNVRSRKIFVNSVISFLKLHNFDGLEIRLVSILVVVI